MKTYTEEEVRDIVIEAFDLGFRYDKSDMSKGTLNYALEWFNENHKKSDESHSIMTDMHGQEIKPGNIILYDRGLPNLAFADIIFKSGNIWFVNWSDRYPDMPAYKFWNQEHDGPRTEIVK